EGTETSHEYHRDPAEKLSRRIDKNLGSGSQLFVFVRDQQRNLTGDPVESLKLLDAKGSILASLVEVGEGETANPDESWHGCNFELDPGTYLLACDLGD